MNRVPTWLTAATRSRALVGALFVLAFGLPAFAQQANEKRMYALFQRGRHADCIAVCRSMLKADPDHVAAAHVLGRCLLATGNHAEARRALDRCLSLQPKQAWMVQWTHVALGQCYRAEGDTANARTHFQRAIKIGASRNATQAARVELTRLAGRSLPAFSFRRLDGSTFDRDAVRGHPVMFKFGPSW